MTKEDNIEEEEEGVGNFVESYYWAHDHDPVSWSEKFKRLVTEAHVSGGGGGGSKKKNKDSLREYRKMRMEIAAQTARMTIVNPGPDKPDADAVAVSIYGCRSGGEPHADPLAVAAYTGYPLLVPVHHDGDLSPDGDLESECRRRCQLFRPTESQTTTHAVLRGIELHGYPTLGNPSWWALTLIEYPHPRTIKSSQLLVDKGREHLETILYQSIVTSTNSNDTVQDGGIIMTGLPFCRQKDKDETLRASAELAMNAFRKAGVCKVVLAGSHATNTAAALYRHAKLSESDIINSSISLWKGAVGDNE